MRQSLPSPLRTLLPFTILIYYIISSKVSSAFVIQQLNQKQPLDRYDSKQRSIFYHTCRDTPLWTHLLSQDSVHVLGRVFSSFSLHCIDSPATDFAKSTYHSSYHTSYQKKPDAIKPFENITARQQPKLQFQNQQCAQSSCCWYRNSAADLLSCKIIFISSSSFYCYHRFSM